MILHIVEAYLTITAFILQSSERYEVPDMDNVVDVRRVSGSQHWLQESYHQVLEQFHPGRQAFEVAMYSFFE